MSGCVEIAIGGRTIEATAIELYPSTIVGEWRGLLALAQQQLGGISTGVGFFGSPGWAIGGALAVGLLENALSSAKAKEGFKTLERANGLLEDVRRAGKFFRIADIRNIGLPSPATWFADGKGPKKIEMSKISMLDRGRFLRDNGLTKADVVSGFVEIADSIPFISLVEDFIKISNKSDEITHVRWAAVDTLRLT